MFNNIWNVSLNKVKALFKIYNWTYFSCAIIKIMRKIIWLDMRFILFTIFFDTIVKDVLDISWFKTILGSDERTHLVGPWEFSLFLSILIVGTRLWAVLRGRVRRVVHNLNVIIVVVLPIKSSLWSSVHKH